MLLGPSVHTLTVLSNHFMYIYFYNSPVTPIFADRTFFVFDFVVDGVYKIFTCHSCQYTSRVHHGLEFHCLACTQWVLPLEVAVPCLDAYMRFHMHRHPIIEISFHNLTAHEFSNTVYPSYNLVELAGPQASESDWLLNILDSCIVCPETEFS